MLELPLWHSNVIYKQQNKHLYTNIQNTSRKVSNSSYKNGFQTAALDGLFKTDAHNEEIWVIMGARDKTLFYGNKQDQSNIINKLIHLLENVQSVLR